MYDGQCGGTASQVLLCLPFSYLSLLGFLARIRTDHLIFLSFPFSILPLPLTPSTSVVTIYIALPLFPECFVVFWIVGSPFTREPLIISRIWIHWRRLRGNIFFDDGSGRNSGGARGRRRNRRRWLRCCIQFCRCRSSTRI